LSVSVLRRSVAAVALLLFAAGCGGARSTDSISVDSPSSPLGSGGVQDKQCGPDVSGSVLTYGGIVLENRSNRDVVIESVSFYGDINLRLVHAVVVPNPGGLIGVAYGWPPSPKIIASTGIRWSERTPAVGARIPPGTSVSDRRNLIVGMLPTAYRSVAAGVPVRYRESGRQYILRTHTKSVIFIAKSTGKC
jgi:hypothetical protein